MTNDFGVASRRILQLIARGKHRITRRKKSLISVPFIEFDLEGTGVGEHVVVRAHTSQDSVDRAQSSIISMSLIEEQQDNLSTYLALLAGTLIPSWAII